MAKMISRNASIARIKDIALKTLTAARARGAEIQALTETRLAPLNDALHANEQQLNEAHANDDTLHAALMARDEESDLEIGAVCDEIGMLLAGPVSPSTTIWWSAVARATGQTAIRPSSRI